MTITELLSRYNELAAELDLPVRKSFRTKAQGETVVAELEAQVAAQAAEKPKAGRSRPKGFNFPADPAGVREHRPGTKRAETVELLLRGATQEEVSAATGWTGRDLYDGIRLVHKALGYGMREDAKTGVITIFTADER